MARGDPQINVRLPRDVKKFIEKEARINASSQSSEVVRSIRERMQRKEKAPEGGKFPHRSLSDASTETTMGGGSDV